MRRYSSDHVLSVLILRIRLFHIADDGLPAVSPRQMISFGVFLSGIGKMKMKLFNRLRRRPPQNVPLDWYIASLKNALWPGDAVLIRQGRESGFELVIALERRPN
jgi:hypothetical protein